jgi:hypothetical protein
MKKILVLAVAGLFLFSCNENTDTTNKTDTTTHAAYAPSDGDVSYRNGKLMVWRGNNWEEADDDVTLEGGVVVRRNGEVVRDGKVVELEDGEVVDRSGRFFDKAGHAIEDAWDATKKGAKEVKEEVKDVFTDDKNDKDKNP